MMSVDNKAIVRRLYEEAWNKRKLEVLDLLLSPSHALHGPNFTGRTIGPDAYKRTITHYTTGYPDLRFTVEEMIAEGDKVVCYWTMSGTHNGEFMAIPPTHKKMSVDGITIHDIAEGKIMDSYVSLDLWSMMQQLGVVAPLGQSHSAAAVRR
ncbi:MAG TPA: ester cyclase [Candidatus Angelobacter sp.]|nr:ester cyclase [Candidatus Angelobacter sp.]